MVAFYPIFLKKHVKKIIKSKVLTIYDIIRKEFRLPYTVNESCIKCKYTDCVEVCPVDCFYEGDNMLVIHPDECIDCGVCEPECPVEAITPDTDDKAKDWNEINKKFSEKWPNISKQKQSFSKEEQDKWAKEKDKKQYFSEKPPTKK